MRKFLFVYSVLLQFFLMSCQKEDDLNPSGMDTNLFAIQNKTGRFNELAYQIYQETGVSVFVNDTVAKVEQGVDAYGNPRYHYEIFAVGYNIFTTSPTAIALSADTNAMVEAARVIEEKVIPNLPRKREYRPYAILLVDTLSTPTYGWNSTAGRMPNYRPDYAYKSMLGITVGRLADILSMSTDEKSYWAGMVLGTNLVERITSLCAEELEDFYVITDTAANSFYSQKYYWNTQNGLIQPLYNADPKDLGFLDWMLTGPDRYTTMQLLYKNTPSKTVDVTMYIAAIYAYSEEEFRIKYGSYHKCVEKYMVMKNILSYFKNKYDIE